MLAGNRAQRMMSRSALQSRVSQKSSETQSPPSTRARSLALAPCHSRTTRRASRKAYSAPDNAIAVDALGAQIASSSRLGPVVVVAAAHNCASSERLGCLDSSTDPAVVADARTPTVSCRANGPRPPSPDLGLRAALLDLHRLSMCVVSFGAVADRAVLSTCLGPPLRRLLRQAAASLFSGAQDHARASRASFRDRSRGAGAEEFELLARDDYGDDA